MKQRIFSHFQDYLIQYISHQYQDLLYCNSSQYMLSTLIIDDYDRLTDWIRPLARGLAIHSLTDS
jgi:hypothetical protein